MTPLPDPDAVLALLKDPNVESQEIATATGAPREEAGRACRIVLAIARAKPEEVQSLPAPLALAVLRAALQAGRADLLAAAAAHPSKDVAKEGKRCLHLLKARGVSVPEPARPPPPAPVAVVEPEFPCYASVVDGHGERAVWIARNQPGRGVEVAQLILSDAQGLLEFQVGVLGRKEFRAFAHDLEERGRVLGIDEVDRGTAQALVAQARRLNGEAKPPPEGADLWLSKLGPAGEAPDLPARFPPLPEPEERAALEASGRLHALPLLRSWLADEDALRALAARLDEIAVSPLYLDEQQREEQSARAVAEAAEAWLDAPRRALLAARLRTVADHLERTGRPDDARAAAAAARALEAGRPAAEIPFARLLVEKAFPARPEGGAGTGREAPLIVGPGA
ncbi:hypothetical protein [Anaeromyxobacter paludicola]|uniref:Uncharacterized protein n=1 Tax=Anaeromyxobacter paludicola TaxID=2918171 RepID=A0ABN6N547_9BACT|nr:hypothetical protein [Anaeromyxobacter paludicola]BDG08297.1 hypothetical protein AMPC_14100 [Anaeromyxobacter paludicola]